MSPTRPDILYINPDQIRADALACYWHPVIQTPNFDRLAVMGVRYEQCHDGQKQEPES